MFDQRDLFGPTAETIHDRFLEFHSANPDVYRRLVELAWEVRGPNKEQPNKERWSVKAAFEVMRYEKLTTTGEVWKLNNSFTAPYARLVMDQEPDLTGFFEVRDRTAA